MFLPITMVVFLRTAVVKDDGIHNHAEKREVKERVLSCDGDAAHRARKPETRRADGPLWRLNLYLLYVLTDHIDVHKITARLCIAPRTLKVPAPFFMVTSMNTLVNEDSSTHSPTGPEGAHHEDGNDSD